MDNLEEYIKQNREAFDEQELPEGHLERFEARLDAIGDQRRTTKIYRIFWSALAVAAAMAAVLLLRIPQDNGKDWFANVGNDQVEICEAYYERVAELYEVILTNNPDGSMDSSASSIAEETVALIDQLPDEMDEAAKAEILKEYYGTLLDGLNRMKNIK